MSIFNHVSALGWTKYKAAGKPLMKGWVNALVDFIGQKFTTETNLSVDTISESTSGSGVTIDGVLLKDGAVTVTGAEVESITTGITAFATGGQAGATALTTENNNVTVCATAGDSVVLPAAVAGTTVFVKNSGAAALDIFPALADKIDALAVNLAVRIQPSSTIEFVAIDGVTWESNRDAGITLSAPTTLSGQLELRAANSAGNTVTLITNASQAGARTYTIPDAGASASFVMNQGATTLNATATTTPLTIDGGTVDHTNTTPLLTLNLDIVNSACNMIYGTIDVTTTGLTADAVYGCYFDINGLSTDNDTSSLNGYGVLLTATGSSAADNVGFIVGFDGTRNTADTDSGIIIGFSGLTLNNVGADVYAVRATALGMTYTSGNYHGVFSTIPIAVTAGTASAAELYVDSAEFSNPKYGLLISKDLTVATALGVATSQTNEALTIGQVTATGTAANAATTVSNNTVYINRANSAALATADVYGGTEVVVTYSATVTGTGTATNSTAQLLLDYNLTDTAGTLSNTAFNVAMIDFDIAGAGAATMAFATGTYNLLLIDADNAVASPAYGATTILNGMFVDVSGMLVTDADLTLTGVNVLLPAAGTSATRGVFVSNGTLSVTVVNGTSHLYSTTAMIVDMPVTAPGVGFDTANGVKYIPWGKRGVSGVFITEIYIDLEVAAVSSSTTDLDIIGEAGGGAAYIGQITAALNGTVVAIEMVCLETPAGGVTDIDLYSATEATGVIDTLITDLTETILITSGGAWASGAAKGSTGIPAANQYLYLAGGAGGTAGAYTAGKFIIRIYGI